MDINKCHLVALFGYLILDHNGTAGSCNVKLNGEYLIDVDRTVIPCELQVRLLEWSHVQVLEPTVEYEFYLPINGQGCCGLS